MSDLTYSLTEAIAKAEYIVAHPEVMLSHVETVALLAALLPAVKPHLNPAAAWPFPESKSR